MDVVFWKYGVFKAVLYKCHSYNVVNNINHIYLKTQEYLKTTTS